MSRSATLVCVACGATAVTLYACRECGSLRGYAPMGARIVYYAGESAASDPGATLHRTEEA